MFTDTIPLYFAWGTMLSLLSRYFYNMYIVKIVFSSDVKDKNIFPL